MTQKIRIAILGASGYTGAELIRLLVNHPHAEITLLTGDSQAGKKLGEVYPHLAFYDLPDLIPLAAADYTHIDVVFCCLPHGTTQDVIAALPRHVKIIDLSADFRPCGCRAVRKMVRPCAQGAEAAGRSRIRPHRI